MGGTAASQAPPASAPAAQQEFPHRRQSTASALAHNSSPPSALPARQLGHRKPGSSVMAASHKPVAPAARKSGLATIQGFIARRSQATLVSIENVVVEKKEKELVVVVAVEEVEDEETQQGLQAGQGKRDRETVDMLLTPPSPSIDSLSNLLAGLKSRLSRPACYTDPDSRPSYHRHPRPSYHRHPRHPHDP